MTRSDMDAAVRLFRECGDFLIAGHVGADGDSLGSICAITLALRSIGRTVTPVSPGGVPELYSFLPAADQILDEAPAEGRFCACIMVDCEGAERLGPALEVLSRCDTVLDIDHHPGGERRADISLVDPSSASTGEIVHRLLCEAGLEITPEIAECLLTAIVTDTGSFRFTNTRPSTLRAAADLVEAGAQINRIAHHVYEARSFSSVKLMGLVLSTLRIEDDGRIAYAYATRKHFIESGAADSETEGIINYLRSIRGVKAAALFRETAGGEIRVSLRSSEEFDVSRVARTCGGGGHRLAAGCTISRTLAEAMDQVLDTIRQCME